MLFQCNRADGTVLRLWFVDLFWNIASIMKYLKTGLLSGNNRQFQRTIPDEIFIWPFSSCRT